MKIKQCKHCNKEFESIKGARYCSQDCKDKVRKSNQSRYTANQTLKKESMAKGIIPISKELLETCGTIKSESWIDVTKYLPVDVMLQIQQYIKKKFSLEEILKKITNFKRKYIEIYYKRIVEG